MSSVLNAVTDASFQQDVLSSNVPVLVDFWATWCGPCRAIAPILEEVAPLYENKAKILKMDVDQNQQIPGKYNIRSIPTLILFKDGKELATQIGGLSKSQLIAFLDKHV